MVPDGDETIADASLREDADGYTVTVCARCGRELDSSEWTPTEATINGGVAVYLFCDEDCKDAWQSD